MSSGTLRSNSPEMDGRSSAQPVEFALGGQVVLASMPAGTPASSGGFAPPAAKDSFSPNDSKSARAMVVDGANLSDTRQTAAREVSKALDDTSPAPVSQPAASTAASATRGLALSNVSATTESGSQLMNQQQFVRVENRSNLRRNFNSPAQLSILNSFQFANEGYLVQITDADGSVYSGQIVGIVDSEGRAPAKVREKIALDSQRLDEVGQVTITQRFGFADRFNGSDPKSPQPTVLQNVSFRVAGTNRTLRQLVEFQGNLLLPPGSMVEQRGSQGQQAPTQALLQQGQIQGRVVIGGRTQIDVRADAAP